jgi:hypothetical protein
MNLKGCVINTMISTNRWLIIFPILTYCLTVLFRTTEYLLYVYLDFRILTLLTITMILIIYRKLKPTHLVTMLIIYFLIPFAIYPLYVGDAYDFTWYPNPLLLLQYITFVVVLVIPLHSKSIIRTSIYRTTIIVFTQFVFFRLVYYYLDGFTWLNFVYELISGSIAFIVCYLVKIYQSKVSLPIVDEYSSI